MKKNSLSPAAFRTRVFRAGGYSVAATALVLALLIAVNLLVGALPTGVTQYDTSSEQYFTLSEQTAAIAKELTMDVTVYWLVQGGYEDDMLGKLLEQYAGASSRIHVVKKDPDIYPTFAAQYTEDGITNNSLVVETESRSRYVDNSEIYTYDYSNYYTTGYYDVNFSGESAVTSAIRYCVSQDIPTVYILTGHGELELPDSYLTAMEQENIAAQELSLMTLEAVPDDADVILLNAPASDLSAEEAKILQEFLRQGGDLFYISQPQLDNAHLTNLEAILESYGAVCEDGIVVEGDSGYYAWGMPYYLLPSYGSHTITSALQSSGYYVILPIAQGITLTGAETDSVTVTPLLTTSEKAFSKLAGYDLTTYTQEDGDIAGPFQLAVAIHDALESGEETNIVWVSSAYVADDTASSQSSGGNLDFFLNCLGYLCEQPESSLSIRAKSLSYDYLTMDDATASGLTLMVVGVLPVAYLGVGIYFWIRRRKA